MECSGSVDFQVTYEGQKTDVLALVTPALQDEVLLSWRTLQSLDVISKEFPCRRRMNTMAQQSVVESRAVSKKISKENPNELSKSIEALIEENKSVFNMGETLKTMSGGPMKIKLKDGPINPILHGLLEVCYYMGGGSKQFPPIKIHQND